jgi:hypothetical protein
MLSDCRNQHTYPFSHLENHGAINKKQESPFKTIYNYQLHKPCHIARPIKKRGCILIDEAITRQYQYSLLLSF